MAAWYFLIYFLAIPSCLVSGQSPTFGLKGGKVFLKPDITGHPDGIRWKFKGNTVVEFEAQMQQVFRPYENRITLNWVTAELNIADLRLEDSGDYELEVEINNALHTSYYALEVMDKVSRPTISCKMNDGVSLNVSGELVCSAEPQPSLKFEWGARGNVQLGPQLQIPLGDEHDDEVYSCSVSNQLSKETTTFTAKDCYPVPITTAVVIIIIIVLILFVGCVAIYCLKRHNTGSYKREAQNDEKRSLVHRESTLHSNQKPFQGNKYRRTNTFSDKPNEATDWHREKSESMPEEGHVVNAKKRLGLEGDAVQPKEPPQEQDPLINQPDSHSAGVSDRVSEDKESSPERPESPEHPEREITKQETTNIGKDDHQEGDADAVQPKEPPQEKETDPEPAGVSDRVSEDKESSPECPESPEHPEPGIIKQDEMPKEGHVKQAKKDLGLEEPGIIKQDEMPKEGHVKKAKKDLGLEEAVKEAEAQLTPRVEAPPAAQALSPLTERSLNTAPKDPAGGLKDVANSGQVTGKSSKNEVGESDSSGEGKRNESDDSGEDKPMSTDPEQRGSRTSLEPEENNTSKESEKVNVNPVPEGEDTSKTNAGDHEETDTQQHLNSANSEQPQSPRTKPDHGNTDAGPESSDTKRPQPDEEEHETSTDSEDTEGQSDEGEDKTVEDKSKTNAGDNEEIDTQHHLNSANSEQLQSPKTKPDHSNTDAGPESSDTKPAQPEAPPTAQALSPLTESSLNTAPKDPAEQKDVTNSGQVTGKSSENEVGESDSGEGKRNKSDDSGEDKPMSNAPEQRGSRTSLEPEENNTSKESEKVNVKPVPEGEDKSKTNAGDNEEIDTQHHLNSANFEQLQSPRTKPDHSNTDAGPESSDTKPAQPEAPPAAQALSTLTEISLNTAPKDPAGEQKDVTNSGQVTRDSAQNEVGESELGEGERNESEDSTNHEQRGSTASIGTDIHFSQGENNTSKESQKLNVKPVSQDEDAS